MIEIYGQQTALVISVLHKIRHLFKAIYRITSAANVICLMNKYLVM
jgi:hypothetical protein